jgi:hypothetical protein
MLSSRRLIIRDPVLGNFRCHIKPPSAAGDLNLCNLYWDPTRRDLGTARAPLPRYLISRASSYQSLNGLTTMVPAR